jgi:hypothetical protein
MTRILLATPWHPTRDGIDVAPYCGPSMHLHGIQDTAHRLEHGLSGLHLEHLECGL